MYPTEVLVLWIMEWSDGYDPHAFSKSNRGSAWAKVITFVSPPEKNNAIEYTYPVALGLSSGNHDVVESRFSHDLLELSDPTCTKNMFYSAKHKEFVRVHVELVVSLMDKPEWRSATSLSRGNSNLGARWGYSISSKDVQGTLVPCKDCEKALMAEDRNWNKSPCKACKQWNIEPGSSRLSWKRPDEFPKDECRENGGNLVPMRLTFDTLRKTIKNTESNVISGNWSKKEAEEYLSYYCIQKKMVDEVIRRSENIRVLEIATKNKEKNHQEYADVMEMVLEDEKSFSPLETPPLWNRGVSMNQHIDVLMHLVFLGAVDGTIKFIHEWLKLQLKYSSFMRLASKRLNVIRRLNLNWCKAIPYKWNKLGGWVSENFLAFAKVTMSADWEDEKGNQEEDNEQQQHRYERQEFFKYPSIATIFKDFVDNVPLSVVQSSCGKLGMVTRSDSVILLKNVEHSRHILLRGMNFIHFKIEQQFIGDNDRILDMTLESIQVTKAYLLLPHPNQKNFYYGISSDWAEMDIS